MDTCAICGESIANGRETVQLTEKGATGVNKASEARQTQFINVSAGQKLHVNCRKLHTDKKDIANASKRKIDSTAQVPTLRSRETAFRFIDHCFLCGTKVVTENNSDDVFQVRTWDCQTSHVTACQERGHDDDWAETVRGRIEFARDLPAVDALYHRVCSINFRTGKNIPLRYQELRDAKIPRVGRRVDISREEAFLRVMDEFRENDDDEQTTVTDLVERMSSISPEPYSVKYMRQKLLTQLGDSVVITNINGRADVVTFRNTAAKILQTFYDTPKVDDEASEKRRVIRTAAALIKADIKCIETSKDFYPDASEIKSLDQNMAYLPELVRILLQELFSGKSKHLGIASVGQSIMQLTRPRVLMAPLQLGLAVQLHHQFGSRFLIDCLHSHGFCVSYSEVINFSKCAANFRDTDVLRAGHFGQYIADNADHNLRTIDGHGTFHGMGIIVAVTPGITQQHKVPKIKSADSSFLDAKIAIRYYKSVTGKGAELYYRNLLQIDAVDDCRHLDTLWKISWPLRQVRPGWSGMMQAVRKGPHPGKASIHFLPMIDMDPTDLSCVFSTLHFVADENRRQGTTPILTFDQPLWWKAKTIIVNENDDSELKQIVLNLGGFHSTMSFLGCIGHMMTSTGLSDVLGVVYAENAVNHMLSGKAYARAIRGHFLVDTALNAIVLSRAYDEPMLDESNDDESTTRSDELTKALQHFDDLLAGETTVEAVCSDTIFDQISEQLDAEKSRLKAFPTGNLWIQYMAMVDTVKQLLKAQRTGNFLLYLETLKEMLPFYAAAGHLHYTKSVYLYIQDMLQLKETNREVFDQLVSGLFVVRRSDRFWAGLPPDLIIEQVLMRSLKTNGGLTRGRGMEEKQRTRWLLAMPVCAEVSEAMQDLSQTLYTTSDQHKDMTEARKSRDQKDCKQILEFLEDYSPFQETVELCNIATGVTADKTANPHKAVEVGMAILKKMKDQDAFGFHFQRNEQVRTIGQKTLSISGDKTSVDPQLLFQRLLIVVNNSDCSIDEAMKYELSAYPTALFDKEGLIRQATKSQLADALASVVSNDHTPSSQNQPDYTVLDGGSLIHKYPWKKGTTFDVIADMYVTHVEKNFVSPIVIFDGYLSGPSTKDTAHRRRSMGIVGPKVIFKPGIPLKSKKEHFLANSDNKQNFINLLSEKLQKRDIRTLHADGDADLLIAKTGVKYATAGITHVIGEDTDILILLCHHLIPETKGLFFRSDRTGKSNTWDIGFMRERLGDEICFLLPFIHAICGCDTTSRLFGIGKGTALKKAQTDSYFRQQANVFSKANRRAQDIRDAGEKAFVCLYGGRQNEGLDIIRIGKFGSKVAKSRAIVQVQNLPPTPDAAKYHSYRVYYQVQEWMGNAAAMNPESWGWTLQNGRLEARTMDSQPAPEFLLKVIRCQCKGNCGNQRCSCRKHGLQCSSSCTQCKGINCTNIVRDECTDADNLVDIEDGIYL